MARRRIERLCSIAAALTCLLLIHGPQVTAFQHRMPLIAVSSSRTSPTPRLFFQNNNGNGFSDDGEKIPDTESILEFVVPLVAPIIAFLTYEYIAGGFDFMVEALSNNNWVAVDGGAYQAKIIGPAINGIVVPAIAVLFATLTSNTISNLRLRQVDIRRAINMEAGELRALECTVNAFPAGSTQDRCRSFLIHYTTRIIAESQPDGGPNDTSPRKGMDSELNRFSSELNQAYEKLPPHLAGEAYQAVSRLRQERINRVTAIQSTYPSLHYAILVGLALGEMTGFLMEANQELLVFLNSVELKILWSLLVGTFVACFTVFYDLRSPFGGSYQISASVDQLYTIRAALKESVSSSLLMQQNTTDAVPSTGMHVPKLGDTQVRL